MGESDGMEHARSLPKTSMEQSIEIWTSGANLGGHVATSAPR